MVATTGEISPEAEELLRAAREDTSNAANAIRVHWQVRKWVAIILGLLSPLFLVYAVFLLVYAVQNGGTSWTSFWVAGVFGFIYLLFALYSSLLISFANKRDAVIVALWAVREAAASGDDRLMPPVADQPEPIAAEGVFASIPIERCRWIDDLRRIRRNGWVVLIPFIPVLAVITFCPYIFGDPFDRYGILFIGQAGLFAFLLLTLILAVPNPQMTADEHGVTIRRGPFERCSEHIPWSEMRSFVRLNYNNALEYRTMPCYILDAGTAIFAWGPFLGGSLFGMSSPEKFDRLNRLVVNRTDLPLREATPLIVEVASWVKLPLILYHWYGWLGSLTVKRDEVPEATIAGLRQALELAQAKNWRMRILLWLSWLPFVLFALLYIVGIVLHQRISS